MRHSLLSGAEYQGQTFTNLQLPEVELENCAFYDCTWRGGSLRGATLRGCRFYDCHFDECDLRLLQAPECRFRAVHFTDCALTGIDWTRADWPSAGLGEPPAFTRCALNHATFIGLKLPGLQVVDCQAREVDFRGAGLTRADFSGSDLGGSLFQGTDLSRADLSRARNYHLDPLQNNLSGAKFSLPEALALLQALDIELVEIGEAPFEEPG